MSEFRPPLSESSACPSCGCQLDNIPNQAGIKCNGCAVIYPRVAGLPWLFVEPEFQLGQWRHQSKELIAHFDHRIEHFKKVLDSSELPETVRTRITKTRKALIDHKNDLQKILAPLELGTSKNIDFLNALRNELPRTQNLLSYEGNIHRDWSNWGKEENENSLNEILSVISPKVKKGLVLGSGCSRLAYDLDQALDWDELVAIDINPLLFFTAQRILNGETIELHEFPQAPVNLDSYLAKNALQLPAGKKTKNLNLVFANIWNPPFKEKSFDTIIAPWLLDILPFPPEEVLKRINALLCDGGHFVYFGSLVFQNRPQEQQYLEEEIFEMLSEAGFEVESAERKDMPYLQSPHNSQSRLEKVLIIKARKKEHRSFERKASPLAPWIENPALAIPPALQIDTELVHHEIQAKVLAYVDGVLSIKDIAVSIQKQYQMAPDEALHAVIRYFANLKSKHP